MPRRMPTVNQEFYHIVQRGIEKRKIFLDEGDHLRFVNSLLVFNDAKQTLWGHRAFWNQRDPVSLGSGYNPKIPLLKIHAFVLMPNHFHLLVQQIRKNGISVFMNKLGGYSYYFNKKYQRVGPLFQGRYRIKHIKNEEQLKNTFCYILTNPIELIEPEWKRKWQVKNTKKAINFIEEKYRWTSYFDYLGIDNFPRVTTYDFFLKLFTNKRNIRKWINSWIDFKGETFRDVFE